ncbi:MobC family plasmid mobilization relaxosome protein [Macrococcus brunensis]|uniref:MobC family plasmid mobilization relaxosome protein n=1 Tax=Macrococcus brunensis TaxID=198483 RepID=UPI003B84A58B
MSEMKDDMASSIEEDKAKTPRRKEARQISFRVSDSEYLKLQQSAETLNMSVAAYAKKKAQNSRVVAPKLDAVTRQEIVRDLGGIANNLNQIAKWCNQNKALPEHKQDDFINKMDGLKKEVNEIWQRLN